ncbi:hypothetical protein PR048_005477 [Dryococelus australis]|uniref:Reverse transcriptase domain-containing protein n=1 Tax=Dryococelus australis TaxID=614101 RepID=A0ABQ9I992_9NEOP|nr:hypothetical protein PR048_005477 [Dryococelus australis]
MVMGKLMVTGVMLFPGGDKVAYRAAEDEKKVPRLPPGRTLYAAQSVQPRCGAVASYGQTNDLRDRSMWHTSIQSELLSPWLQGDGVPETSVDYYISLCWLDAVRIPVTDTALSPPTLSGTGNMYYPVTAVWPQESRLGRFTRYGSKEVVMKKVKEMHIYPSPPAAAWWVVSKRQSFGDLRSGNTTTATSNPPSQLTPSSDSEPVTYMTLPSPYITAQLFGRQQRSRPSPHPPAKLSSPAISKQARTPTSPSSSNHHSSFPHDTQQVGWTSAVLSLPLPLTNNNTSPPCLIPTRQGLYPFQPPLLLIHHHNSDIHQTPKMKNRLSRHPFPSPHHPSKLIPHQTPNSQHLKLSFCLSCSKRSAAESKVIGYGSISRKPLPIANIFDPRYNKVPKRLDVRTTTLMKMRQEMKFAPSLSLFPGQLCVRTTPVFALTVILGATADSGVCSSLLKTASLWRHVAAPSSPTNTWYHSNSDESVRFLVTSGLNPASPLKNNCRPLPSGPCQELTYSAFRGNLVASLLPDTFSRRSEGLDITISHEIGRSGAVIVHGSPDVVARLLGCSGRCSEGSLVNGQCSLEDTCLLLQWSGVRIQHMLIIPNKHEKNWLESGRRPLSLLERDLRWSGRTLRKPTSHQQLLPCIQHAKIQYIFMYIDDICMYSKTLEEHVNHIWIVLDAIRKAGWTEKDVQYLELIIPEGNSRTYLKNIGPLYIFQHRIMCQAHSISVGTVLSQIINGNIFPIACASKMFMQT